VTELESGAVSEPIRREELLKQLIRAAQFRSAVTMVAAIPLLMIAFAIDAFLIGAFPFVFFGLYFGGFLFVSWVLTKCHCRRAVTCPRCGYSLWSCGSGNFKPRRMRIKEGIAECPNCHTPIV
jgi:hypothetical protein